LSLIVIITAALRYINFVTEISHFTYGVTVAKCIDKITARLR